MVAGQFNWTIEPVDFFHEKDSKKLSVTDFCRYVIPSLNSYKKYSILSLMEGKITHCHCCETLNQLKSGKAKRLYAHFEKINERLSNEKTNTIDPSKILQLPVKGYPGHDEFRCFGYVIGNVFYLVCLDIKHEVYKE